MARLLLGSFLMITKVLSSLFLLFLVLWLMAGCTVYEIQGGPCEAAYPVVSAPVYIGPHHGSYSYPYRPAFRGVPYSSRPFLRYQMRPSRGWNLSHMHRRY